MTNTDTGDPAATLGQITRLAEAGCELVRVAVPDTKAAAALRAQIVAGSPLPLVADIHFNHRLALAALEAGVAKLRINPGNIGARTRCASWRGRPGSAGYRSGSGSMPGAVEQELLERHGGPTAAALADSALGHCSLLEEAEFTQIVVSLKASDVPTTVAANRLFAAARDYPLHLGVTEAGTLLRGAVLSSVGLGLLLAEGLGDTIRVSLTADPVEEVGVAWMILSALGLRRRGAEVISCPTCGRTEIDLIGLAQEVERRLRTVARPITVAVMGCVVNGPGEAREADYGIAGGHGMGLVFRHGKEVCRAPEADLVDRLMELIEREEPGREGPAE